MFVAEFFNSIGHMQRYHQVHVETAIRSKADLARTVPSQRLVTLGDIAALVRQLALVIRPRASSSLDRQFLDRRGA